MTGDLVVRDGGGADLAALTAFAGSADRAEWRLRAALAGTDTLLVAEHAGALVAAVSVRWAGPCDPPHPWLYGLHVRDDVRRHGLGALLVRSVEAAASLRGAAAVSLDADRDEEGLVRWYERLGYRRVAPHDHHWRSVETRTGRVTAQGVAATWIMRHDLSPTR